MKLGEAIGIIQRAENKGFIIAFDRRVPGAAKMDFFPDVLDSDNPEDAIEDEKEAMEIAGRFAAAVYGRFFNVRILTSDFRPTKHPTLLPDNTRSG